MNIDCPDSHDFPFLELDGLRVSRLDLGFSMYFKEIAAVNNLTEMNSRFSAGDFHKNSCLQMQNQC